MFDIMDASLGDMAHQQGSASSAPVLITKNDAKSGNLKGWRGWQNEVGLNPCPLFGDIT